MSRAWLRLSFGSWTPVWKVKLPFQLAGKEGTPSSGILWGEGKGNFLDPILEGFPSGYLGEPGDVLLRHRGGRRKVFPPCHGDGCRRFKLDVEGVPAEGSGARKCGWGPVAANPPG